MPKFDLIKHRHGRKFFVKVVKSDKEHSWRDKVVNSIIEVCVTLNKYAFFLFLLFQCIQTDSRPNVWIPVLDDEPSVRPTVKKPDKMEAIRLHQSRMVASDMHARVVPARDVQPRDVQPRDTQASNMPTRDMQGSDSPSNDMQASDVLASNVQDRDVLASEVQARDVLTSDVQARDIM